MQDEDSAVVAMVIAINDTAPVSGSIETLARRHQAELLRILRARLKSAQDAEDLAQEAYTRLLRHNGRYNADELRRMLFRIASNLLTDHWRWGRLRGADTHVSIDELDVEADDDTCRLKVCSPSPTISRLGSPQWCAEHE